MEDFLADVEAYRLERESAQRQITNAIRDAPEPGPGYPSHDDLTKASRLMGILRPIEDDIKTRAKVTETADLIAAHERALSEQKSSQESERAIAFEEQKRLLECDHHNALQKQKQQSDEERDSVLQTQKQQLEIEHDNALQEQQAQFEQIQNELQEDKEVATSAFRREVESNDAILRELLDRITRASQYLSIEPPEDIELSCKVEQTALQGKLTASRTYRAVFEELRCRLSIPLEQLPSFEELLPQEHNDEATSLLTSQVDSTVQACDNTVDAEQRRSTNLPCASLISKMKVTEQVSSTSRDMRGQVIANDKLSAEVVTKLEACLVAKDQHIEALTKRLRLQTQVLDERHVLLERLADAAAASVG
ncbi:uncharacterized protein J4E78_010347 [Alternaria triticimaculans]|uniref:uncharacterized protein n=1 Tax=Alternaria triticimaculans TaxID=297637 RepID=UPI0020C3B675|nr:uncharacterized protein J4E78_010347 [Alternaria triticimaculans]KAI4641917.1 hypothetical protein J4E78_010347 [Alternaria triticimaculans]